MRKVTQAAVVVLAAFVIVIAADRWARRTSTSDAPRSSHFHMTFIGRPPATGAAIIGALENARPRIAASLGATPAGTISVRVYGNRWAYSRETGHWAASGNIEGTNAIHVLAKGDRTSEVAVHELAHAITLQLLIDGEPQPLDGDAFDRKFASFPVWLWEAVACHEARQFRNPLQFASIRDGRYPSLTELNNRSAGVDIYDVGFSIVEFIETKWGHDVLVRLIREHGAIERVLGISDSRFMQQWRHFVEARYASRAGS